MSREETCGRRRGDVDHPGSDHNTDPEERRPRSKGCQLHRLWAFGRQRRNTRHLRRIEVLIDAADLPIAHP